MENASKALIMAGEVLISVIIVSMLMLVFNSLSSYQQTKEQNDRDAEVLAFNTKYEDYNRNDVRGNELYSLIVIDYNTRKSTAGSGNNDEGQDYNYKPIKIIVDITIPKDGIKIEGPDLKVSAQPLLFKKSKYEISNIDNTELETIFVEMRNLEEKYGESNIYSLASNYTHVFKDEDSYNDNIKLIDKEENENLTDTEKKNIIKLKKEYIEIAQKCKTLINEQITIPSMNDKGSSFTSEISTIWNTYLKQGSRMKTREDVCKYYEYIVFTRAHFDCTSVKYDEGNGRIIEMKFKYNGKIN